MTETNVVRKTLTESQEGAIYVMDHVTSSNGALSGAKKYFADTHDLDYGGVDGTLFTKGYGPADNVAAVKINE